MNTTFAFQVESYGDSDTLPSRDPLGSFRISRFEAFRGAVSMAVLILFCNPKRMTKRLFNFLITSFRFE